MATTFYANQKPSEDRKQKEKNERRIQDFFNRFKLKSRDLEAPETKELSNQDWQGYAWVHEATRMADDRSIRYREYREMCKTPELNLGVNIYSDNCLHPDTVIHTLKGDYTIKELSETYKSEEIFDVWSYDIGQKKVTIGKAFNPRRTLKNVDIYEIIFEDNRSLKYNSIKATNNHPFLMRDATYKTVKNLKIGDRIMPFNLHISHENHKIIDIKYCGKSDVYDLSVEKYNNFSANGIFVHNSTQNNISKNVLEIQSDNNKNIEILETLFFDTLDINSNLWKIVRNMCKLGDEFLEIIPDDIKAPKHIVSLERFKKIENIKRIEKKGVLEKFVYTSEDKEEIYEETFMPWKVVHFRIEEEEFEPYGKSILEAGRNTWKKLSLMEDAMLIYRISRAPERRVFYIDIGTLSTKNANNYIEQIKRKFKKKAFVNPRTGEIDEKSDVMCITLDTQIPLLDGRVLTLQEIIKEYENSKELWAYSINREDGNNVVPGKISWAGVTRKNANLVEIILDNGKSIRCTPDHNFMLRDGTYKEAQYLQKDDALMPWYTKLSENKNLKEYEMIYNPKVEKYETTHSMVAKNNQKELWENWDRVNDGIKVVHHCDFNKHNNMPNNLTLMNFWDHKKYHMDHCNKTLNTPEMIERKKKWLLEYHQSGKSSIDTTCNNLKRNSVQAMKWYNGSELHKNHNKIRSENMKKQFSDPELRKKYINGMTVCDKFTQKFWDLLDDAVKSTNINSQGYVSIKNIVDSVIMNRDIMSEWNLFSKSKQHNKFNKKILERALRHRGFNSITDWIKWLGLPTKENAVCIKSILINNAKEYSIKSKIKRDILYNEIKQNFNKQVFSSEITKFCKSNSWKYSYIKNILIENNHEIINSILNNVKNTKNILVKNFYKYSHLKDFLINENISKKKYLLALKSFGYNNFSELKEYKNHKIVDIKFLNYVENTGCITVDKWHNFATNAGCIIKNSITEDFYIPVRQNSAGTRIETLPPGQNLGEVDDVLYFKNIILKTMGIPPGYMGGSAEGGAYDSKSYLSNQEIQFSRTIERIQKFIIKGLEKIAIIELALNKVEEKELKNFKIILTPPSNIAQLMGMEIRTQQFTLIQTIKAIAGEGAPFLADEWIYKEVLGFSEQEINKAKLQSQMQLQQQLQLQQIMGAGAGGEAGSNISPAGAAELGAGGNIAPTGAEGGPTAGGPEETVPPPAETGLEVANRNFIEFDGGKWLMENQKDVVKMLKYIRLYEEKNKQQKKENIHNGANQLMVLGELKGLIKPSKTKMISDSKILNIPKTQTLRELKESKK